MLDLGKAIKLVRTAQGKSVGEVAKKAKVGAPFLSLVEKGRRQPSIETLRRLSDALSVPSEVLILLAYSGTNGLRTDDEAISGLAASILRVDEAEKELRQRILRHRK